LGAGPLLAIALSDLDYERNDPQTDEDPAQDQTHFDSRPARVPGWLRINFPKHSISEDNRKDRGDPIKKSENAQKQDHGGPRC
jgi:hypothetical protein